jgi:hypothetical protein
MHKSLWKAALLIGLALLVGCSGNTGTKPGADGTGPKDGTGQKPGPGDGGGDQQANQDPKVLADLDKGKETTQEFAEFLIKVKWADAREMLTKGYRSRLLGETLKDDLWVDEALAKTIYFPDHQVGSFASKTEVPAERKLDKAAVTSALMLTGEEGLYEGNLTGAKRKARFVARTVKDGGKWKVDSFLVVNTDKEAASASPKVANDTESARAIAGEFLDEIVAARYNLARGICTPAFLKKLVGEVLKGSLWEEEKLATAVYFTDRKEAGFVRDLPVPEEKKFDAYSIKSARASGDEATVEGELTGPKRKADFKLKLAKEGGKWRINSMTRTDK